MPSKTVSQDLNDGIYFLTFTVKHWYYIFDRYDRWKILEDSINFCIENKNLKVYAYVFMLNHIHLIIQSPDVSGFIRDFKKHTALELMKNIESNEPPVADLFKGENGNFSIWKKTNMPVLLASDKVFAQKKNYIELNPVTKKYVEHPEHWCHSSAHPKSKIKCSLL